jgi:hypothetical protein
MKRKKDGLFDRDKDTAGGTAGFIVSLIRDRNRQTSDFPRRTMHCCRKLTIYANRYWIEEMLSDHKSRGLNLESTRLTDPDRIERLLVAVTLAYLWIMEVGALVVTSGQRRQVDNRGASRSVSLCQIGLRWLSERRNLGFLPPLFSGCFKPLEAA